ncbi:alanyl-trna synthetase [Hordeum vulgare]|nr:alanyl-trna synthetase [Hordeum vulgare]
MTPQVKPPITSIEKVCGLIDFDTWTWRQDVIRDPFTPSDAGAIPNIPIRQGGEEDFLAWAFERSGNYTVKTAYRALVTQEHGLAPEEGKATGSSQNDQQLWKAIQKLNVIPKVRVFWWRVLRGILPVEITLKHCHIAVSERCRICSNMDEDLKHALIQCPHALGFWEEACVWFGLRLSSLHPSSWARDITCDPRLIDEERAKITTIMWSIRYSQNRVKYGEESWDPVETMRATREAIAPLNLPHEGASILLGLGWRLSDTDVVEINTNDTLNIHDGVGGAGGVARLPTALLGSSCKPYVGVLDPLIIGDFSLRDGVHFAAFGGFSHVG